MPRRFRCHFGNRAYQVGQLDTHVPLPCNKHSVPSGSREWQLNGRDLSLGIPRDLTAISTVRHVGVQSTRTLLQCVVDEASGRLLKSPGRLPLRLVQLLVKDP